MLAATPWAALGIRGGSDGREVNNRKVLMA